MRYSEIPTSSLEQFNFSRLLPRSARHKFHLDLCSPYRRVSSICVPLQKDPSWWKRRQERWLVFRSLPTYTHSKHSRTHIRLLHRLSQLADHRDNEMNHKLIAPRSHIEPPIPSSHEPIILAPFASTANQGYQYAIHAYNPLFGSLSLYHGPFRRRLLGRRLEWGRGTMYHTSLGGDFPPWSSAWLGEEEKNQGKKLTCRAHHLEPKAQGVLWKKDILRTQESTTKRFWKLYVWCWKDKGGSEI